MVQNVEKRWNAIIDLRTSFGSMAGKAAISNGITWVGASLHKGDPGWTIQEKEPNN